MIRRETVRRVFAQALEAPAPQRPALLDQTCGGDTALRAEVQDLLEAYEDSGGFLGSPTSGLPSPDCRSGEAAGDMVGPYRLVQQLGEGGFGTVFLAEQEEPLNRRVALKILKPGMDTRSVIARFGAERLALSMMDHPSIARVLDAGATASGRPFFIMELVEGEPITDYCDRCGLSLRQRLGLLVQVCAAVQHAHSKAIIHRDIKPSNVLVAQLDGLPVPKVIDFGIAKALNTHGSGNTEITGARQLLGTPEYMSPEQIDARGDDIDTRSDIYSLGVLMYEMLVGVTPVDRGRLRSATWDEFQRILKDEDPPRPSTRALLLERSSGTAAEPRAVDQPDVSGTPSMKVNHAALARSLRGDLDWIVMKCLEKDRSRRYETASGLAMDLQRHLDGQPVLAAPPSVGYVAHKFVRRHRIGVGAAALVAMAVASGTAATVWQAVRASRAESATALERDAARNEARRAAASRTFLTEMLADARPGRTRGSDVTVRQSLDRAVVRLDGGALRTEPEIEAAVRSTIGESYLSLGHFAEATTQLAAALAVFRSEPGPLNLNAIACLNLLGNARDGLADFGEGERLHRESLAAVESLPQNAPVQVARVLCDLGACLHQQSKLPEAEEAHRRALSIRENLHPANELDIAESLDHLGVVMHARGKSAEAEPLLRQALKIRRSALPADHPDLARTLSNLGYVLHSRDMDSEAELVLREAIEIYRRTLDPGHPDLALCLNNLAMILKGDRNPEAVLLLREAIDIQIERLGPGHPEVAGSLLNLAHVLWSVRRPAEAIEASGRGLEIFRNTFGARHKNYALALHNVAVMRSERGDPAGAEPMLREAKDILEEQLGPEHVYTVHMRDSLGVMLIALERPEEAAALLSAVLQERRKVLGEDHIQVAITRVNLAVALLAAGEAPSAERTALEAMPVIRKDPTLPQVATAILTLAEARLNQPGAVDPADFDRLVEEALAQRMRDCGENSWQVADVHRISGLGLVRLGRLDDAEREFLGAISALQSLAEPELFQPRRVKRKTIDALVSLYRQRGQEDQASLWLAIRTQPVAPAPSEPDN